MSKISLCDLHLKNKEEFNDLLNKFNIVFYGYGCKKKLLKRMFEDALVFNCVFLRTEDFIASLKSNLTKHIFKRYRYKTKKKDIFEFMIECDNYLKEKGCHLSLVILNFRFEYVFLQKLKNIHLVATLEDVYAKHTCEDIYDYNFVYRDLTTFIPYEEEILDIKLETNRSNANNVINIAKCVSNKSKKLFIEVLKGFEKKQKMNNCDLLKIGKKFLITKISTITDLLREFFDHKVIKNCNNEILLNLNESCVNAVIKHFEQSN